MKKKLYQDLVSRMEAAAADGRDVEAAWFAYAVLEDRLRSLLRQSGGEGQSKGIGKPIRMMGPKLKELAKRAKKDELLKSCFEYDKLNQWKHDRNDLVHAMADGSQTIEQIDAAAASLASEGVVLARTYAAAARRLKKNRAQVAVPPL
ncbi:hypothetical protein OKW76_03130 [Sphingomonas sp. S1-29]|uniref:hypothetical protein n=1 Tax=Sphingomonas sp. S1-29 TaxID=2991074 RepID=UPI00223ECB2A|nr:hypothetical protein [Sphingomonas sp. S1-29]UZK70061.1 hypothetical protein OKW76_03130 [Sphingomonas sp. S1-29]